MGNIILLPKIYKTSELNVDMNPLDFELLKPYPNPFNPEKIEFNYW